MILLMGDGDARFQRGNGGNGFDYVVYSGAASAYTWSRSGSDWLVRHTASGVSDTLTAVEVLRFSGSEVLL